jgi:hypothetical protein
MKRLKHAVIYGACLALLPGCGLNPNNGTGLKVGQIIALHHTGLFYKTYECEIIKGSFSQGSGANGGAFWFTIEDEDMAKAAQKYMDNQTEVKLKYRTEGCYSSCRSDSGGDFAIDLNPTKP